MTRALRVAVIGGGIVGLSTAMALGQGARPVRTILELRERPPHFESRPERGEELARHRATKHAIRF